MTKEYDGKISFNGAKLKVKVIPPVINDEYTDFEIKPNWLYLIGVGVCDYDIEHAKSVYKYISDNDFDILRKCKFRATEVAGERTIDHKGRIYVEVVSKFYVPPKQK